MSDSMNFNETCNFCDYTERIAQFKRGKNLVYGKHRIDSYQYYDLINETGAINVDKIEYIYSLFLYNLKVLTDAGIFKVNWLQPEELIPATEGAFWSWNDDEELNTAIKSYCEYGFYFPIFTLPKGIPHNQIEIPENMNNLYNAYNGNHRISVLHEAPKRIPCFKEDIIDECGVMTIEIPPFCEKSCTGFKYTPLKYNADGPINIPELQKFNPIPLFHLNKCNIEMKIDLLEYEKICYDIPLCDGVDVVNVCDYQLAFRILQEFQNVLEYPLTAYYKEYNALPLRFGDMCNMVNHKDHWDNFQVFDWNGKVVCPLVNYAICMAGDISRKENCAIMACCVYCNHNVDCPNRCVYSKNKER